MLEMIIRLREVVSGLSETPGTQTLGTQTLGTQTQAPTTPLQPGEAPSAAAQRPAGQSVPTQPGVWEAGSPTSATTRALLPPPPVDHQYGGQSAIPLLTPSDFAAWGTQPGVGAWGPEGVSVVGSVPAVLGPSSAPATQAVSGQDQKREDEEFTVSPWKRLRQIAFQFRAYDQRSIKGTLLSVMLHAAALLLCAEMTVSHPPSRYILEITGYRLNTEEELPLEPVLSMAPAEETPEQNVMASIALSQASLLTETPELPPEALFEPLPDPDIKLKMPETVEVAAAVLNTVVQRPGQVGEEVLHVDGAVDRITAEIMQRLELGPVMVVWLMDESISLVDDRAQVATRLQRVYDQIEKVNSGPTAGLLSSVIGFGQGLQERVPPTTDAQQILSAIGQVQQDPSGIENIFSSILWAVQRYRPMISTEKRQIMIVAWTDESGDDYTRLEDCVALCQRYNVPVFTVGPSAMFGKQLGLHHYVDPEDGQEYDLPVFRGPDTAFQERIDLPYWFGGSQLPTLHSGLGPYALTRLAMESGGAYFINDAQADRSPFRLKTMRPYMPFYGSPQDYLAQVQTSPLRQAIRGAVQLSYQLKIKGTPQLEFAPTGATYQTELLEAQKVVAYNEPRLRQMLGFFGQKGFEEQYQQEEDPRWRAWYDYTYGRLLAMYVRNSEYNQVLAQMKGKGGQFVDQQSNRWNFKPAFEYTSSTTQKMGEQAQRLLQRCIKQNQGTPWELLANRELQDGFGFDLDESYVAPPPPPMPVVRPANPNPNPPPPPPPPQPPKRRTEQLKKLQRKTPEQLPKL